jgi:hypothetical protein
MPTGFDVQYFHCCQVVRITGFGGALFIVFSKSSGWDRPQGGLLQPAIQAIRGLNRWPRTTPTIRGL